MLPNTPANGYANGREDVGANSLTAGVANINFQQNGQPPGLPSFRPATNAPFSAGNSSQMPMRPGMPAMPKLPQFAPSQSINQPPAAYAGAPVAGSNGSFNSFPSQPASHPAGTTPGGGSYPQQTRGVLNGGQTHGNSHSQPSFTDQQQRLGQSSNQPPAAAPQLPNQSNQQPGGQYTGPGFGQPQQPSNQPLHSFPAGHNSFQQHPAPSNQPQQQQQPAQYPNQPPPSHPGQPYSNQPQAPVQYPGQGYGPGHPAPTGPNSYQPGAHTAPPPPGFLRNNQNPAAEFPQPGPPQMHSQPAFSSPQQYPQGGPAPPGPSGGGPYYPGAPQNNASAPPGYPGHQQQHPQQQQQQQQQQQLPPAGQFPQPQRLPFPGGAPPFPGGAPPSNGYPQNMQGFQNQPGMLNMGAAPPGPQFPGSAPGGGPQFPGSAPGGPGPQLGPDGRPMPMGPSSAQRGPQLTNEVLPSVIEVLERDRQFNSGVYQSRLSTVLPPLVSSGVRSVDCGNSVPELLRSSLYAAPCTANLLKDSGVPFVLHMQPMAELPVDAPPIPIVNHGEKGPVRCGRCKAYMSPYMKFVEGGKKFHCPFCLVTTEVPQEYFAYLDSEGRRVDIMQRAELCLGTYEFLGTKDYCRNEKLPEPPAFIFMIDVSYRAISSGMVAQVCQMLRTELESLLPVEASGQESKLRVGIATFSDSVHFFNLKAGLKQPSMMTVNDFSEMFVPLVDGFLVRLEESGQMFDKLLEEIPKIFADARQVDTILLPVVQAGMRALEAAGCPGKLFIFNFSLPVFDAPGKLKNRDNREILGTDKEKTMLKPQNSDYTKLAEDCVKVGCSVDLFLFPNAYIDVATLSEVSRLTGGQIYKYAYFTAEKDGNRFLWDLRRNLKRCIAFDAVLRVRTSAGIRPTDYFGNLLMSTSTEVHLASLDSDKVILAEIKHDDKLENKTVVHIQVALLYTSLSAQRRVRVLNMALMSSSDYAELFRLAEIDVIMNFMMKNSVKGLYEFSPAAIREGLTERATKMLAAYRNNCSTKTTGGQLVLPETLKLLPIYTGCLIRNDIVSGLGSEVGADDRSWLINHVNSLSVDHATTFLYPRLLVLTEFDDVAGPADAPRQNSFRQLRSTTASMRTNQAYLLENGVAMFMWLGSDVDPGWVADVFGVASVAQIDIEKGDLALSTRSSPTADQLRRFITMTRNSRPVFMRLMITRQGDKMEAWFRRFLVEDQGTTSFQQSYVQYIYYLHNAIRDEVEK